MITYLHCFVGTIRLMVVSGMKNVGRVSLLSVAK